MKTLDQAITDYGRACRKYGERYEYLDHAPSYSRTKANDFAEEAYRAMQDARAELNEIIRDLELQ